MDMNSNIHIESGGFELLPKIEKLWYSLKRQQAGYASDFCDMSTPTFELRQKGLKEKSKALLVEIAIDQNLNTQAGYCFSIVDHADTGEVESVFLKEEYRRCGIGRELVTRAIKWMDQKNAKAKRLSVFSANEEAIAFYKSMGFRSRVLELMIPNEI